MLTEKPKIQRTYVTLIDPDTKRSLHRTFYNVTPEQVLERLDLTADDAGQDDDSPEHPSPRATASA